MRYDVKCMNKFFSFMKHNHRHHVVLPRYKNDFFFHIFLLFCYYYNFLLQYNIITMNRLFTTLFFIISIAVAVQALPVFDAELVASPLMHDVRINYRGARKAYSNEESK